MTRNDVVHRFYVYPTWNTMSLDSKVSSGPPILLYFSEEQNSIVIIERMSSKYHTCSFEEDAIKAVLKYR
jgi:hypothetical protein